MSNKLYESLKMENASLNQLYKNAISKMKKMQNEYEAIYLNYLSEKEKREKYIKNNYFKYQELLQRQYEKQEKNYLKEINNLKLELNEKNKIINTLQKNNSLLQDKLTKNELIFHLKEKEYEKEILSKDRLLIKSSDIVKENSKEVMEDIQKLKDELNFFQNKINMANNNNNQNNINNNNSIINNKFLNFYDSDLNNTKNCFCNCHKNRCEFSKSLCCEKYNLKKSQLYEINFLKNKINYLNNVIKQKDEEILFWKNIRRDLCYSTNKLHNKSYENILSGFNFETRNRNSQLNNINTSSNKKLYNRSSSQSSNYFTPFKRNFNLNLIDSNSNKPIKKYHISNEEIINN